jgi:hypothetical protein
VAAVIVILNPLVVAWSVPHLMADNNSIELTALIVVGDLLVVGIFLALVGLAIGWRRIPRHIAACSCSHRSRSPGRRSVGFSISLAGTPLPGIIGLMVLPLLVVVHDRMMMKRVHSASAWGAAAIIGSLVISIAIANTAAGDAIVRLVPVIVLKKRSHDIV